MKHILLTLIAITAFSCKAQTIYNFVTPPEELLPRNNFYLKDIYYFPVSYH